MSSNSVSNHTRDKQIGLPLRGRPILLSLVWLQTELDSTQSYYHYLLHCRTGQKYGLKRSDKVATQNEPNFASFTSADLNFLMDEPFTEMDFLTEQTETSEFMVSLVLFMSFARVFMQSIRCKMDFEN